MVIEDERERTKLVLKPRPKVRLTKKVALQRQMITLQANPNAPALFSDNETDTGTEEWNSTPCQVCGTRFADIKVACHDGHVWTKNCRKSYAKNDPQWGADNPNREVHKSPSSIGSDTEDEYKNADSSVYIPGEQLGDEPTVM